MTYSCKCYIIRGEESTDNVLKLIGEQIENFKAQGFAFLSINTFWKAEPIEKDRHVIYETYKEEIAKIIKDTEVTDFNVSLKTSKGDVLYMFDFGFTKFVGLFFDLDECEKAYEAGGVKKSWMDYSYSEPTNESEEWNEKKFYEDFDIWWLNLPKTKQGEITSLISHTEVI
jgi:hypothetical protein